MSKISKKINFDDKIRENILDAIKDVSTEILKIYRSNNLGLKIKDDRSPLTLADMKSHEILVSFLKSLNFNIPIVSEESFTKSNLNYGKLSYWLIDPLDGTKEFIAKNGEFTVNVALIENKKTTFGFVSVPCKNEIYWGGKDFGSWKKNLINNNVVKLNVSKSSSIIRIVVSKSHLSLETEKFLKNLPEKYELFAAGSSLKFLMIAEGNVDLYPRLEPTSEWDTAAAQAILEGARGKVVRIDNHKELLYSKSCIKNPFFLAIGDNNILKKLRVVST